jgi:hypothetical protein
MAVQSAPVTSVAGVDGHERQRRHVPVTPSSLAAHLPSISVW